MGAYYSLIVSMTFVPPTPIYFTIPIPIYNGSGLTLSQQGPRAQMDRKLYKTHMQHALHNYGPNLSIRTGSVYDLVYSHTHTGSRPEDIRARIEGVRLGVLTLSSITVFLHAFRSAQALSSHPHIVADRLCV